MTWVSLVQWFVYSTIFLIILSFSSLCFWDKVSLSLIIGFFAGILNQIITYLKSISNEKH